MYYTFGQCINLKTVPNISMTNVMLMGCTNLVDVPNFDLTNVVNMK